MPMLPSAGAVLRDFDTTIGFNYGENILIHCHFANALDSAQERE
jgi:hypothetical protein